MKRPLAYITAAWCGSDHENTKLAAQYCRTVYEAGFSPICPTLYQPLFLNDAVPEEHKSGIAEWEQEYADLKEQRDGEYGKLKEARAEVGELQKIRKCVEIARRADQPEQIHTKRQDLDR